MKCGNFELADFVSQECPFSQSPSEQFQADTSLHLVLLDVLLRVMAHNVYTCIPGIALAIALHCAYAIGIIYSQSLDYRLVPLSACHRK